MQNSATSEHGHVVMIVDDDEGIRDAIADILSDEGYAVVSASDGKQALERLRAGGILPCLIFLDLMMPVMDGWEFRSQQSSDPLLRSIPVAIITAGAPRTDPPITEAFIPKPIEIDKLLEVVHQFC